MLWSSSGMATVLDNSGSALAINDNGRSVGSKVSASGTYAEAVRWSPLSGPWHFSSRHATRAGAKPVAINDAGQSVGISGTASGWDAVLWSRTGAAMLLDAVARATPGRRRVSAAGGVR